MKKTATFFVLIFLTAIQLYSQDDGPSAKDILTKYIQVIGGREKIMKISSYSVIKESSASGTHSTIEKKVIINEALLIKNTMKDISTTAIIKNKIGVNITSDGIFSMPNDQIVKHEAKMMIVPEINYLGTDYNLEYLRLSELDDTTHIHEIRISNTKGFSEVRAYNSKTGLLSILMSSDKQLTIFSNYKEVDGVHLPFNEKKGARIFITKEIALNKKFKKSEFNWNSKIDLSLCGEWIARKKVNSNNQTEFTELKLEENRGGSESMGVFLETGEKESIDFLTQKIIGWKFSNDTIKITYYSSYRREQYRKNLVLQSRSKDELIGYFSEPDMDRTMKDSDKPQEPIILTFKKIIP